LAGRAPGGSAREPSFGPASFRSHAGQFGQSLQDGGIDLTEAFFGQPPLSGPRRGAGAARDRMLALLVLGISVGSR